MERINVICFYWEGDRWQRRIDPSITSDISYQRLAERTGVVSLELASAYVNNLYAGVKRFSIRPFDFICFTNEELSLSEGIEKRNFPFLTKKGVLPRLWMFSKESGLYGRQTLCFDLDVFIVGALEKIMGYNGLFCARSKFKPSEKEKLDGDIMSFQAGEEITELFWDPFIADVDGAVRKTMGRERYWVRSVSDHFADRWDRIAPGAVISYKWHVAKNGQRIPKGASVISCHGIPRPHQIKHDWVKRYWKWSELEHSMIS
jgi:hypothetical protein